MSAIPLLEHVFLDDGGWAHVVSMREERFLAFESLARINNPESVPTLILAAGDSDEAVRKEAQRKLLMAAGVMPDLRKHWLLTEDWFLRQGAMITLMDYGSRQMCWRARSHRSSMTRPASNDWRR